MMEGGVCGFIFLNRSYFHLRFFKIIEKIKRLFKTISDLQKS